MWIGFKGAHNASCLLVQALPGNRYFLTNSFPGVQRDIADLESSDPYAILIGVDRTLQEEVRIEAAAVYGSGEKWDSLLDVRCISETFEAAGVKSHVSACLPHSLCNEAYWHLLREFHGIAVLIHIPTIKYYKGVFAERLKQACSVLQKMDPMPCEKTDGRAR